LSRCASWLSHRLLSSSHCAALWASCRTSWLSHCLFPSSRCAALSSSSRAGWLPHHLSSFSHFCAAHSSCHRAGWLMLCRRPLVVSLSRRAASRCLITSVGCRIIISRRPLIAPPSCPLIVLAGCCIASPCAALSSSSRSPSPTPSNAVERCCRHQTPNNNSESFWEKDPPNSFELNRQILSTTPPPPPLKAVSIVHRCHSCRPSPPSYDNAHLRPSPPSNA
jgi:hypothetical protein